MHISRHNYEEFFILYLDNELGSEERRQVELFVKENPDLGEEMNLLRGSKLSPDESICFDEIELLLKQEEHDGITLVNCQEWLLLYIDNELSSDGRTTVEHFAAANPSVQEELELLLKTRLQPELEIVLPNKEALYRREEKARVVAISWKRIAAAAAILLAVATTAFFVLNKKEEGSQSVAGAVKAKEATKSPAIERQTAKIAAPDNITVAPEAQNREKDINTGVGAHKEGLAKKTTIKELVVPANEEALVVSKEKKGNDLAQPTHNPYVNGMNPDDAQIARLDPPVTEPLTKQKDFSTGMGVTSDKLQPLNVVSTSAVASSEPSDVGQSGRKNKLRGFFRKITRTFEKATNIKATDEEDRLLIGGLAIKL